MILTKNSIRNLLILLLTTLFAGVADARNPIDNLQLTPAAKEVLLYRISPGQARYLTDSTISFSDSSFFRSFVKTDQEILTLPYGHYLKVSASGPNLLYEYIPVSPFILYILDNSTDFLIRIKDKNQGTAFQPIQVTLDGYPVAFDKATDAYRLPRANLKGLLDISNGKEHYYYKIGKSQPTPSSFKIKRGLRNRKAVRAFVRAEYFIVSLPADGYRSIKQGRAQGSIYRIKEKARQWIDNREDRRYERKERRRGSSYVHTGDYNDYTFFSKPKYRPRDTVSFKLLLLNNKTNRWLDIPLTARLRVQNETYFLGTCTPRNASGYYYTFLLSDTMKLRLDQRYTIELIDKDSARYAYCDFPVEEYELQKSVFNIECLQQEQVKGKPFELRYTAKDENGLPMRDTKAAVTVTAESISRITPDQLFVPYQIWKHEFAIEDGIKNLAIPDSLFARADFRYTVNTVLSNAENERKEASFQINYVQDKFEIREELSGDSISFRAYQNDSLLHLPARLRSSDRYGYFLSDEEIRLPYATKINTHVSTYSIQSSVLNKDISIDHSGALLTCNAARTGDSLFINVDNPRHLPFSYQLYERNKELVRGNGSSLSIQRPVNEKDIYYIAIQYIWAGRAISDMYQVPLRNKLVNLKVEQPQVIYPGKETAITITATDYKNRPVKDMSILSYAYTAKFRDAAMPTLPDLSSKQKEKYVVNNFSENSNFRENKAIKLNYNYWRQYMELDTMMGYRFIFPENKIEKIEIPAVDSITQVAPFVTDSGQLQGIHYVLLNQVPVYFGFTDHKAPYSFETRSMKYNQIQIRTPNSLVIIDSFDVKPYYKTLFTVDLHRVMRHVTVKPMPDTLTPYEVQNYSNYIVKLNELNTQSEFRFLSSPAQSGVFRLKNNNYNEWSYRRHNYYDNNNNAVDHTIGPIASNQWTYHIPGAYTIDFEAERYFTYTFKPQLVKMVSIDRTQELIRSRVSSFVPGLDDWVITPKKMNELFLAKPRQERRAISFTSNNSGNASLQIEIETLAKDTTGQDIQPLNIILTQPGNFNFIHIYSGTSRYFSNLQAGSYELLLIEEHGIYRRVAPIQVRADGINFYRIRHTDTLNSVKIGKLDSVINALYFKSYEERDKDAPLIMGQYLHAMYTGPKETITGKIVEDNGKPSKGAMVKIKGTLIGTLTDINGNFSIDIPLSIRKNALFEVTALGYRNAKFEVSPNQVLVLKNKDAILDEVAIYGQKVDKKSYTGSVTTITAEEISRMPVTDITRALEGSVAGVSITSGGGSPDIQIRGQGSLAASTAPLIVIDGVPYSGTLASLDPSFVQNMTVLKDASATGIYGARGANGVILISTKKGAKLPDHIQKALEETMPVIPSDIMVGGLRNNFKDDAFWYPNLVTDKEGKVSFKVKFPDDLTSWNTFVYATDAAMHVGQTSGNIRSFKPVSASLQTPQFLVQGDSSNLIGKSVNYIPDTIPVTNTYFINDSLQQENRSSLAKYHNEILPLVAPVQDSLRLKYLLTKTDGYFDGEEKTITIVPRGVSVAKGDFLSLDSKDTLILIPPANPEEPLYLNATASLIDIVMDEIEKVKEYKHLCNEQLSSKIIATLNQQRLYEILKKPVDLKHKADIQKMINLLVQRQNSNQLWGWWGDGESVIWISAHVMRALGMARDMQYNIGQLNFERIVQPVVYKWERDTSLTDIQSLKLLQIADIKVDYEKYIRRIEHKKNLSLGQKLELIRFRQQLKLPYDAKPLTVFKQEDLFGNIFWKDTVQYIYENDVLNTLTAFKIIQADTAIKLNQHKVINWLIQQRKVSGWRNIYESAQIIEAIASAIDLTDTAGMKPVLSFSGGLVQQVNRFPFQQKLKTREAITVRKTGASPVYFTWYQRQWDTTNNDLGKDFIVSSAFGNKTLPADHLKAGEAVQLKVQVKVIKSAEFVMIDIPIPAGCSYNNKGRGYYGNEIHREYYKDRVSIFCQELPKGTYTYTVDLLPRYTGTYTLNPAKAELMYFPVFYGREKIRRVDIE